MRTDDLIAALARDPVPVVPRVEVLLLRSFAVTVPLAFVAMALALGIRSDLVDALLEGWFGWKLAVVAICAVTGWALTRSLSRPGRKLPLIGLGMVLVAFVAGDVADVAMMGAPGWSERMMGDNWIQCLVAIPLLSVIPLAGLVHALRDSAPTQPALAGAAAGLLAGAVAAFLYGLHCTDDSPLFVSVWYVVAMALTTLAGAVAGKLALKW